ncbi:ATP-grasp domain-containing protein [Rosistilla oblonga]|uniref:ATP-grasp domain-containing protein n=1 Tax=Rosistilla oblonga TaxID=2527990 RepID=UPI003A972780
MSSSAAGNIVLVGATARAAAQSARRSGLRVAAIDLFGDRDLREACDRWSPLRSDRSLTEQLAGESVDAVVPLGGLESRLQELDALRKTHRLFGATAQQIRQLNDPAWLDRAAEVADLARPPRCSHKPSPTSGWLFKRAFSTGGLGVFPASQMPAGSDPSAWFECQIPGRSFGVNFLASRDRVDSIGVAASLRSRQRPKPFQYEGSIGLLTLPDSLQQRVQRLAEYIVQETQLRGLFGIDVIVDPAKRIWLLELNPRWTASMELFDRGSTSLLQRHIAACKEEKVTAIEKSKTLIGKRVLYADHAIRFAYQPLRDELPDAIEIADIPADSSEILAGDPVCTLIASGPSPREIANRLAVVRQISQRILEPLGSN